MIKRLNRFKWFMANTCIEFNNLWCEILICTLLINIKDMTIMWWELSA